MRVMRQFEVTCGDQFAARGERGAFLSPHPACAFAPGLCLTHRTDNIID